MKVSESCARAIALLAEYDRGNTGVEGIIIVSHYRHSDAQASPGCRSRIIRKHIHLFMHVCRERGGRERVCVPIQRCASCRSGDRASFAQRGLFGKINGCSSVPEAAGLVCLSPPPSPPLPSPSPSPSSHVGISIARNVTADQTAQRPTVSTITPSQIHLLFPPPQNADALNEQHI